MRRLSGCVTAPGGSLCCRVSWKGSKKRKKKDADKLDYYKLLGLENTRWMATDSQIKKGDFFCDLALKAWQRLRATPRTLYREGKAIRQVK